MYEHVRGRLERKSPSEAVVDAGGVGYRLQIPLTTYERLPAAGTEVRLWAELVVREDAHRLFGFATEAERAFFLALQTVSGVGPSLALSVVSAISAADFRRAVEDGDAARLRKVRGIGKKLADRLVVEMRDRVSDLLPAPDDSGADRVTRDALMALEALGFPREDAAAAVRACREEQGPARDPGDLVRQALRRL
ncbi:MAG: Holliday junction ATP-dependent DNA helicase RuvA [Planctomycetes bacterium]|nr:Holliday junction ATP-dependent DNA helicase RuvA [Planctomycetota bacterium]